MVSYPTDDSPTGVFQRVTKSLEKNSMDIGSIPEAADVSNLPLFLECYTLSEFPSVVFYRRQKEMFRDHCKPSEERDLDYSNT